MSLIKYVTHDNREFVVEGQDGLTAMVTATSNNVPGIDGDCGGSMACGTCHVYVEPAWTLRFGEPNQAAEREMLEMLDNYVPGSSRLSCQIIISPMTDGLVLKMPRGQH